MFALKRLNLECVPLVRMAPTCQRPPGGSAKPLFWATTVVAVRPGPGSECIIALDLCHYHHDRYVSS